MGAEKKEPRMIAVNSVAGHSGRWQQAMRDAVTDADELVRLLGLDPALVAPARLAAARFGLKVPRGYLARMRRGDPADPLLRQVLPLDAENREAPGFTSDPVGDLAAALLELAALDVVGVLHVAGAHDVSRAELAELVAGHPVLRAPAPAGRPLDCSLDSSRARGLLSTEPRGIRAVFS